jgi:hypothetical protein
MARENHQTRRQAVGLLVKLNPPDKMERQARSHISADPPSGSPIARQTTFLGTLPSL